MHGTTRPASRVDQVESTWAFQVRSSQSAAASPSKVFWEVVFTSNLAPSSSLKCGYWWVWANKAICNIFQ